MLNWMFNPMNAFAWLYVMVSNSSRGFGLPCEQWSN
jgi:hypothetical protein